ncbi:MAG: prepilin-type cleavage/methylation domain-containing protein [Verrucomicrobia bacterium]|nr:prepilin-type cleavage/methylation domain-containing protein [Verrucomicrobiota bacterium]
MKLSDEGRGGFTLIEVMIISGIVGLVAIIAVPNLIRARLTAQKSSCIANLKQIDGAMNQWAVETKKSPTDTYSLTDATLLGYIKGSSLPICPGGGTYSPGVNMTASPTCNQSSIGHTL